MVEDTARNGPAVALAAPPGGLAPDPGARFETYLGGLRSLRPSHTNRASGLGFPCERRLVYERTAHEQAALPDLRLQGILEFGQDYEHALRVRLQQAGYRLRSEQVARHWKGPNISGHPEGELSWDEGRTWTLVEIKGLHQSYWGRVVKWQDFLALGPIYAQYPAQGQLYMLLENRDRLLFILGRKGSYDLKWLWMDLDYEYAEALLKKAERINRMVENGPLPDRVTDPDICRVCSFKLHCLPNEDHGAGAELLDDPELLAQLRRRDELAPLRAEYEAVDKGIKGAMKGRPLVLIDEYRITGKEVSRKGYEVKPSSYWDTRILNLQAAPEGPA